MSEDHLTRPERAAEVHLAKQLRARILKRGGCAMCVHRVEAFGHAACNLEPQRVFPACLDSSIGFELDPAARAA